MPQFSDRTWLCIILLLGVALRVGVLWTYYDRLAEDPDGYRAIGASVAAGEGFRHPQTQAPTAYRPPVFPLLLAMLMLTGPAQAGLAVVHLLLGVGTIWMTWSLGCRLGLGRFILIAAAIVAVDPILLQYTAHVMTETSATFLIVWLLWLAAGDRTISESARSSTAHLILMGFVFGLCALCRPTVWAFGGLLALRWFFRRFRRRPSIAAAPLVIGLMIAVGPWMIRNTLEFGRPILTTTHGGYTLLLGNNPVYYDEVVRGGWWAVWSRDRLLRWQADLESDILETDSPVTGEVARDRWMYDRARRNIKEHPQLFLRACLLRLGRGLWGVVPLTGTEGASGKVLTWCIGCFYVVVLAGMLWGIVSLRTKDAEQWMPLLLLLVAFTAVHSLYWANMRMRAPLMPAVALLFALGLSALKTRR